MNEAIKEMKERGFKPDMAPGDVIDQIAGASPENKGMSIVIPQWQGGGQDLCTYHGAYGMMNNYLDGEADAVVPIGTDPISPVRKGILGYDDILRSMKEVNAVLMEHAPGRIFTIGGGCDADTPCAAWLNLVYNRDLAVVYIDSHGDLNTPRSSESQLYYGMSLRALAGESAPEIIGNLASVILPDQLITCGNRNLDPEEVRYKEANHVTDFTVDQLERDPDLVAGAIREKGYHNVYIHIDFDVLDPREFSLTPLAEPDGMTKETLIRVVRSVAKAGKLVGLGLLEYSGTEADRGDPFLEELISIGRDCAEHV